MSDTRDVTKIPPSVPVLGVDFMLGTQNDRLARFDTTPFKDALDGADAAAAQALATTQGFEQRVYPGVYDTPPTVRPWGGAPVAGDRAVIRVAGTPTEQVYSGSGWVVPNPDSVALAQPSGSALVGYESGTAQDVLDNAKPMQDYDALRAYTGRATGIRITTPGIGGVFQRDDEDDTTEDNGGTVIVDALGRRWKRDYTYVDIRWFGAVGNGIADGTTAIQAAIESLRPTNGGKLFIPEGQWLVTTDDPQHYACLVVDIPNVEIYGVGAASLLFTRKTEVAGYENAPVILHVTHEDGHDLSTIPDGNLALTLRGFKLHDVRLKGTGEYQYYGLARGRGLLLRRVEDASVHHCTFEKMAMIGVSAEGGRGYFDISDNRFIDNRWGGIAFNGGGYQSIVRGNIISGSNGSTNTSAIQVTGQCLVTGNTIYGDLTNPQNCGGIAWGENTSNGTGVISGNFINHCRYGITALLDGPVNITGNTVINCSPVAGINLIGETSPPYTVTARDSVVSNNLVINCANFGINSTAKSALISNNRVLYRNDFTSENTVTPSYIDNSIVTAYGIIARGDRNSVVGNSIIGTIYGIVLKEGVAYGAIEGNNVESMATAPFQVIAESTNATMYSLQYLPEIKNVSNGGFQFIFRSPTKPAQGYFTVGSQWISTSPTAGAPATGFIIAASEYTASTAAAASDTVIYLDSRPPTTGASNAVIGVQLDTGAYHWTGLSTASDSPTPNITLTTAIPAGRSVAVGAKVKYNRWAFASALS